jgi:hypothetical protein
MASPSFVSTADYPDTLLFADAAANLTAGVAMGLAILAIVSIVIRIKRSM